MKGRDTRIVALKSDIESGAYSVEPEQVAEKIMKNLLLIIGPKNGITG
jgi:anti-sigma28 factor (negative regulator of flagellin synthesis)